ncbi:transglutaminase domain-containing protein [Paraclostridium bifermentans]|uniref:transglutaminase domain-containing protein n=1 Tax=Paraclostridium bifermentans TaxID=1490 RepID=UPI00359CB64A
MKRNKALGILLLGAFVMTPFFWKVIPANVVYAAEEINLNEPKVVNIAGESVSQTNLSLANDLAARIKDRPDEVEVTDLFDACGATWQNKEPFVKNVIKYLEYADADFYAFRGTCSFRGRYQRDGSMKIFMTNMHWEETIEEHNQVVEEVDRVVAMIPKNLTTAEKIFWVNNYLATTAQYNNAAVTNIESNPHAYTPYGVLLDKTGVCESYAKAFAMIMKRLDIKSYRVTSMDMNHTWNIVEVDGKWYNIDVTHNDPVGLKEDELTYNYFLKSSDYLDAQSGHQAPDEKFKNLHNTDRDENPFGIYGVKKPTFENDKFYFFNNHYNFSERWNIDKTVDLKVYNPNNNTLETVKDRIEKPIVKIGDKTVVIKMNVENKKAEAFYLSNLNNPIGEVELKDLKSLKILKDEHGKSAPMNSIRVDSIELDGSNLKLNLLSYNQSWNNPLLNDPYSVIMPISLVEPVSTEPTPIESMPEKPEPVEPTPIESMPEKPEPVEPTPTETMPEKPESVEPTPIESAPEKPEPVEPTPIEPAPEKPKPVEPTPIKPAPEKPEPVEPTPTEPAPEKPKPVEPTPTEPAPEKPTSVTEDPYADIKKMDDLNQLVYRYNSSYNIDERNAVISRIEELYQEHYKNFKTTYDYKEGNLTIRIASMLGKKTDVYSLHSRYQDYINAKRYYETTKFWYQSMLLSYDTMQNAYNQMKKSYDTLTDEYRKTNTLPKIVSERTSYRSFYRNL